MYDRILTFGGFNPLHNGHLCLFEEGLGVAKAVDVYVGKRAEKQDLEFPYEFRRQTIETLTSLDQFNEGLFVLDREASLFSLSLGKYSGLLVGSNLLNESYLDDGKPKHMPRFFRKFERLFVLHRLGEELTDKTRTALADNFQLIEFQARSSNTATSIRRNFKKGREIEHLVPGFVYDMIQQNPEYLTE